MCAGNRPAKTRSRTYRKRESFARVAELGNTSRRSVNKWWDRFCEANKSYDALEDRSSRPHTIHRKQDQYEDKILEAKERFPYFSAIRLKRVTGIPLSHTTIHEVLAEHDLVDERGTTWRTYQRLEGPYPNYLWQMDIPQVLLPTGEIGFSYSILDDHSLLILASKVLQQELATGCVLGVLWGAIQQFGQPHQVLTDRGSQLWTTSVDPSLYPTDVYVPIPFLDPRTLLGIVKLLPERRRRGCPSEAS